jgi:DNA-binding MarR family transcriptional regulator
MYQYEDLFDLVFENLKRIAFPEELLALGIEMSKQELFTIMIVDKFGEITMSQISDQMNFPMSTATGIIDRLVKTGYVQRSKNEADRRVVAIALTDKGRAFAQYVKENISQYIKIAYDALNDEERQSLFGIFNKVIAAFRQIGIDSSKDKIEQNMVKKIEIE